MVYKAMEGLPDVNMIWARPQVHIKLSEQGGGILALCACGQASYTKMAAGYI
jgi:hypothetical protein